MDYQTIIYEKRDRVATVTLNRPESLNAFDGEMGRELSHVFREIASDDDVMATVLTGAGRGFCSGAYMRNPNVHVINSVGESPVSRSASDSWSYMQLWNYPKPLIGAINGAAYGSGLNISLGCDIIIASTEARFCFPMARLGIIPHLPGAIGLALYVGKAKAAEMAIMARPVTGEDAYRWGLANKVVPPEELMNEAYTWAHEIAGLAPLSLRLIKEDLQDSWRGHFTASANPLRAMLVQMTDDRAEGHTAMREKRAPVFKGR